jgi:hypothetical protein
MKIRLSLVLLVLALAAVSGAAPYPAPLAGDFSVHDFQMVAKNRGAMRSNHTVHPRVKTKGETPA